VTLLESKAIEERSLIKKLIRSNKIDEAVHRLKQLCEGRGEESR